MKFTHEDQVQFAKLALRLRDLESENEKSLKQLLAVSELIKQHSTKENAIIYDVTEYIYEQFLLVRGEGKDYPTSELRRQIEETIKV